MTLSDPRQLEAVPMRLLATAIRSSILAQRTGLSIIPTIATCVATTPRNGKHHCRFLPLLPPITRNVKLPIPTIRLEFPLGHESPAGSNSKNGKNGNVHRASQHCRPTTALSSALDRWPIFSATCQGLPAAFMPRSQWTAARQPASASAVVAVPALRMPAHADAQSSVRVYCRHILRDAADDMPRRFALSAYPSGFSPLAVRRHFSAARSENERSER